MYVYIHRSYMYLNIITCKKMCQLYSMFSQSQNYTENLSSVACTNVKYSSSFFTPTRPFICTLTKTRILFFNSYMYLLLVIVLKLM